jgi:hypothetical protein
VVGGSVDGIGHVFQSPTMHMGLCQGTIFMLGLNRARNHAGGSGRLGKSEFDENHDGLSSRIGQVTPHPDSTRKLPRLSARLLTRP